MWLLSLFLFFFFSNQWGERAQSASSLQNRRGNRERYRKRKTLITQRSLKRNETDREKNPNGSPSFCRLSYLLSLCLHLHCVLNKVLRDPWQVGRRGAEFQSGPSEFRHTDGGQRWWGSLNWNFISAAHSGCTNTDEAKEEIINRVIAMWERWTLSRFRQKTMGETEQWHVKVEVWRIPERDVTLWQC